MLDIKYIRENPEKVREGVQDKGFDSEIVDQVIALDEKWRKALVVVEELRQERNAVSKKGMPESITRGQEIKKELKDLEAELDGVEKKLKENLYKIPNLPLPHLPKGDESQNKVLKTEGEVKKFTFKVRDHLELGETLGIIDVVRAAKISGTRFAYLKNEGVLLELALVNFAMSKLVEKGFSPIFPPALVKQKITEGLGYWQGGGNENYYLVYDPRCSVCEADIVPGQSTCSNGHKLEREEHALYLVGTGEHSVVPMHMDEVLNNLPKKYAAFSSCFRREAGTYGKDTRGMFRVHQFDKVEMIEFVKEEDDAKERGAMLEISEGFLKDLGLPYRLVQLATGDVAFPTAETIDIETWIPSQDKYRETHSISTTTDFQARRLNIKYNSPAGGEKKFAHILNGTAFAIGRTIISILENYQQEDGTVIIPEVLRKYTGFAKISTK